MVSEELVIICVFLFLIKFIVILREINSVAYRRMEQEIWRDKSCLSLISCCCFYPVGSHK